MAVTSRKRKPGPKKGESTTRVYEALRRQILSLELPPGVNLSEPALVKAMGVSRTPVREAITRLVAEGLVEVIPNEGARVVSTDIAATSEVLEAFHLCQRTVTRWAAINRSAAHLERIRARGDDFKTAAKSLEFDKMGDLNQAFHQAIGEACGNKIIAGLYTSLLGQTLRLARIILARRLPEIDPTERYRVVISEHDAIVEAIEARDADRAEQLGGQHAELFRRSILTYLATHRAGEISIPDLQRLTDVPDT